MQYWGKLIAAAQKPNPLSSRDGKLLKPVPKAWLISTEKLSNRLVEATQQRCRLQQDQLQLLLTAWQTGKQPGRAELALIRGYGYLQAGIQEQAERVGLCIHSGAPVPSQQACTAECL